MPAMGGKEFKAKMEERRAAKPAKVKSVRPTGPAVRLGGKEKKAKLMTGRMDPNQGDPGNPMQGGPRRPGWRTIMPVPKPGEPRPRPGRPGDVTIMPVPQKPGKKIGRPVPPRNRK